MPEYARTNSLMNHRGMLTITVRKTNGAIIAVVLSCKSQGPRAPNTKQAVFCLFYLINFEYICHSISYIHDNIRN